MTVENANFSEERDLGNESTTNDDDIVVSSSMAKTLVLKQDLSRQDSGALIEPVSTIVGFTPQSFLSNDTHGNDIGLEDTMASRLSPNLPTKFPGDWNSLSPSPLTLSLSSELETRLQCPVLQIGEIEEFKLIKFQETECNQNKVFKEPYSTSLFLSSAIESGEGPSSGLQAHVSPKTNTFQTEVSSTSSSKMPYVTPSRPIPSQTLDSPSSSCGFVTSPESSSFTSTSTYAFSPPYSKALTKIHCAICLVPHCPHLVYPKELRHALDNTSCSLEKDLFRELETERRNIFRLSLDVDSPYVNRGADLQPHRPLHLSPLGFFCNSSSDAFSHQRSPYSELSSCSGILAEDEQEPETPFLRSDFSQCDLSTSEPVETQMVTWRTFFKDVSSESDQSPFVASPKAGTSYSPFSPVSEAEPIQRIRSGKNLWRRLLVGSFEESVFSGQMYNRGSNVRRAGGYLAVLAVSGVGGGGKKRLPFTAAYLPAECEGQAPPYFAGISLDSHSHSEGHHHRRHHKLSSGSTNPLGSRWRVPLAGQLHLVLSNPEGTPLHTFTLAYDLTHHMPANHKCFIRQTIRAKPLGSKDDCTKGQIRYGVNIRFIRLPSKTRDSKDGSSSKSPTCSEDRLYIFDKVSVIFSPIKPDSESEHLITEMVSSEGFPSKHRQRTQ